MELAKLNDKEPRDKTNSELIQDVGAAVRDLEIVCQNVVDAYHQLVTHWHGETAPLKDADGSVKFFKEIGYVQKGIDVLQDIVDEIRQMRMF